MARHTQALTRLDESDAHPEVDRSNNAPITGVKSPTRVHCAKPRTQPLVAADRFVVLRLRKRLTKQFKAGGFGCEGIVGVLVRQAQSSRCVTIRGDTREAANHGVMDWVVQWRGADLQVRRVAPIFSRQLLTPLHADHNPLHRHTL